MVRHCLSKVTTRDDVILHTAQYAARAFTSKSAWKACIQTHLFHLISQLQYIHINCYFRKLITRTSDHKKQECRLRNNRQKQYLQFTRLHWQWLFFLLGRHNDPSCWCWAASQCRATRWRASPALKPVPLRPAPRRSRCSRCSSQTCCSWCQKPEAKRHIKHDNSQLRIVANEITTTTTTWFLWPFIRDYLGEPVPEENIHTYHYHQLPSSAYSIYYDP